MSDARDALNRRIDAERERLVRFFQDFVRIDTSNPPGDTRSGAALIRRVLEASGIEHRVIAPQEAMPNIVASFAGAAPGPHLILNGHIDVFPIGDSSRWSRDPLCGDIVEDCVFGRGSVDMKCGTTASLFAFAYLHAIRDQLKGRVTLTLVSDEETGGRWGSGYLVEHHPEVLGDCVLNGEPSSRYTVRFGEKGIFWLRFRVKTPGAHAAYPHLSASATKIAARLVLELEKLEALRPETPPWLARILARPEVRVAMERGLGRGAVETAGRLGVNIGVLQGGVKVNMLPGDCVVEADFRLPVGLSRARVLEEVRAIVRRFPEVSFDEPPETIDATASDPEHPMLRIIQDNAQASTGVRPVPVVTLGGTDCRFWRANGVPAFVYGCLPDRMGAPDERVPVGEFLDVVRVHTLSAYDFLMRGDARNPADRIPGR